LFMHPNQDLNNHTNVSVSSLDISSALKSID